MVQELKQLIGSKKITVIVPGNKSLKKFQHQSGFIWETRDDLNRLNFGLWSKGRVSKAFHLVHLDESVLTVSNDALTSLEVMKLKFAYALLKKEETVILTFFFSKLIYQEQQYFKRLLRNLVERRNRTVILFENDMNFVCEFVKQIILISKKGDWLFLDNLYDKRIYEVVDMPNTVELITYLEQKGHYIDHELTFNETLKAIYRGVS